MSASALLRPGPSASKPTGRDLPRPGRGPDHDQDESYFEAGRVDRAVHKMRAAVQKMTVALSSRKTRTPPEREREGRGLGTLMVWAVWRAKLRGLRFANSRARPKVPHGTSCSLLTRHHAQAPTVLDHPCALPQGDGSPRPALAGGEEGGERDLIVLDAGDPAVPLTFEPRFAQRGSFLSATRRATRKPQDARRELPGCRSIHQAVPARMPRSGLMPASMSASLRKRPKCCVAANDVKGH